MFSINIRTVTPSSIQFSFIVTEFRIFFRLDVLCPQWQNVMSGTEKIPKFTQFGTTGQ